MCLVLCQYSFSQEKVDSIDEIIKSIGGRIDIEMKTELNTYMMDSLSIICGVRNKNSPYADMKSNIGDGKYLVMLEDYDVIKEVAKEALCGCFNEKIISKWTNIGISMSSDLSGKINSASFTYESALNIPITAIEKFERGIKERCRLKFDINNPVFSQANYVNCDYAVFLKEICY